MRRFGWSDDSQEDAQKMADARTEEALQRFLSGERLPKYEPKIAYNGADGVPIREEIVDRRGETILTRNSYGALCLNTPDVFFIDIYFGDNKPFRYLTRALFLVLVALAVTIYWGEGKGIALAVVGLSAITLPFLIADWIRRGYIRLKGGGERFAMGKVDRFVQRHKNWSLRVYRTPAGLRLLAAHRKFSPSDPKVSASFEALGSDPMYRMMCLKQQCFRARVSPKPWRIGLGKHIRPGAWPLKPEHLPARREWITRYEDAATGFSSCSYVETKGVGLVDPSVATVIEWHDELCRAKAGLPIA
jgi:hypothetical protein